MFTLEYSTISTDINRQKHFTCGEYVNIKTFFLLEMAGVFPRLMSDSINGPVTRSKFSLTKLFDLVNLYQKL